MKEKIEFSKFLEIEKSLEISVGKILSVEDVNKSNKLIKLEVEFEDSTKIVVTNIKPLLGEGYKEKLINNSFLFVTNLNPTTIMGIVSEAMILPGSLETGNIVTVNGSGKVL